MLPPFELLAGPGQVAAPRLNCVGSRSIEVTESEAVRGVQLMVQLSQKFVRVKWTGNIALPFAAGNVGSGNVVVDDLHRHRIETVGADYVGDAFAGECQTGGRIDRLGPGGAEVADTFQSGRNDGPVQKCVGRLAQAGIGEEEEALVVLNGAADGAAELVTMKGRPGQLRAPVIGIEHGVAQELKRRAVKLVGAGL